MLIIIWKTANDFIANNIISTENQIWISRILASVLTEAFT